MMKILIKTARTLRAIEHVVVWANLYGNVVDDRIEVETLQVMI